MASSVFDIKEHVITASHIREYARASANSQNEPLLLHVKQYTPKTNGAPQNGDLTVIASHANGFPKELYEPLWEGLVENLTKKDIRVGSIWIADCAWQGRSGILNEDRLGDDPSWFDYSRDILQIINHFRMPRPFIGIGHSFGACALVQAALFHPRLFSALVLIDPPIIIYHPDAAKTHLQYPLLSARRRDVWPSRHAAAAAFRKSSFCQSWDPRVLDLWLEHGLAQRQPSHAAAPAAPAAVTLATSKHQEVFTFTRPSHHAIHRATGAITNPDLVPDMDTRHGVLAPVYRPEPALLVDQLAHLRPWTLWVFAGRSDIFSSAAERHATVSRTGIGVGGNGGLASGRVDAVVADECGHLIPFEAPGFVARAAADYAAAAVQRWRDEEREYQAWTKRPLAEKSQISKETLAEMAKVVNPKL